jgi:hypothetical protein
VLAEPRRLFGLRLEGLSKVERANIYHAQGIMRQETARLLEELEIAEPAMSAQVETMQGIIEDNRFNIIGIVTRDGRHIKETIRRAATSGLPAAELKSTIKAWGINAGFFALATLAHTRATVRGITYKGVAQAVERGEMEGVEEIEDQPWVVLPGQPSGRVKELLAYKIFTTAALDKKFKTWAEGAATMPDWRGLGLSYNTAEFYIPVRAAHMDEAAGWAAAKRAAQQ